MRLALSEIAAFVDVFKHSLTSVDSLIQGKARDNASSDVNTPATIVARDCCYIWLKDNELLGMGMRATGFELVFDPHLSATGPGS